MRLWPAYSSNLAYCWSRNRRNSNVACLRLEARRFWLPASGFQHPNSEPKLLQLKPSVVAPANHPATVVVPVSQHHAPAGLAIMLPLVVKRPVGVAMNQQGGAVLIHFCVHLGRRYVHNLGAFHLLAALAFATYFAGKGDAFFNALAQNLLLPGGTAEQRADFHIFGVLCAQAVAVHQQYRFVTQLNNGWISQQCGAGLRAKNLTQQKIAVAVHQKQLNATVAQCPQCLFYLADKGVVEIVTDPDFKKIAQNVQRLGILQLVQEAGEALRQSRTCRLQMQVGNKIHRHYATISAFRIITSSTGTSWWPIRLVVGTPLMRFTTSMPSTTLPNTA